MVGEQRGLQFALVYLGLLQQVSQQTALQFGIAVNRNGQTNDAARFSVNMMAAADPQKRPAAALDDASELTAGNRLHIASSRTRSPLPRFGSETSTERQPSIAWCRLRRSSSMVSPWLAQPGMAGTSPQKPPSSASCTMTLIFMAALPVRLNVALNAAEATAA